MTECIVFSKYMPVVLLLCNAIRFIGKLKIKNVFDFEQSMKFRRAGDTVSLSLISNNAWEIWSKLEEKYFYPYFLWNIYYRK